MGIGKILQVIRPPQRKGEPSETGLPEDSGETAPGVWGAHACTERWQAEQRNPRGGKTRVTGGGG